MCILCTAPESTGELVFENEVARVIVHDDWSVRGHVMIVSRAHVENPSDLRTGEWDELARIWHRTESLLLELTGCERAIAMKLGILTPHLHVHLYPVAATATREEVFAAIDGKSRVPRDEAFVASLRDGLGRPA
jgi:diadenosine tetraphosphate (Ap4A) HIT family hydrolase